MEYDVESSTNDQNDRECYHESSIKTKYSLDESVQPRAVFESPLILIATWQHRTAIKEKPRDPEIKGPC